MEDRITTKTAATALARELSEKGLSQIEIGKELAKRGWVSIKTKGPLTQGGVCALLNRKKYRARKAAQPVTASRRRRETSAEPSLRLKLVRSICEQTDMDPEDRLAAISLLLN